MSSFKVYVFLMHAFILGDFFIHIIGMIKSKRALKDQEASFRHGFTIT